MLPLTGREEGGWAITHKYTAGQMQLGYLQKYDQIQIQHCFLTGREGACAITHGYTAGTMQLGYLQIQPSNIKIDQIQIQHCYL